MSKLVELKRCYDVSEAHAVKGYLASNDIDAKVFDDHAGVNLWYYMVALGGIRVYVAEEDFNAAQKIIRDVPKTDLSSRSWLPDNLPRWTLFISFVSTLILYIIALFVT